MLIARILGFYNVKYFSGAYFKRALLAVYEVEVKGGFQIDLLFDRADNVIIICEIKYHLNPIVSQVIVDFEQKIALFDNKRNKTIHKILITSSEPANSLKERGFFDYIITLDLLLQFAAFAQEWQI